MFVFALAAGFHDGVPAARWLKTATGALPIAAPDGTRIAEAPHAAAAVGRWIVVRRDSAAAPSWDPERRILFAGDVRLYNRPELIGELGLTSEAKELPDLELARRAYLKWAARAPLHMIGDFAIAAWDEERRELFAARDHLGMRSLHYRLMPGGVAVATDVRQLLALVDSPIGDVSPERILDRFTGRARVSGRTFFRSIARLPPGHHLAVHAAGVRETRYWTPPPEPASTLSYADNCDRLREIFRRAVRDRLDSDTPLIAHSSGGFDSSTIVMAADEVYRREPGRPPLVTVSGIAPGFACDESHYMDAVDARVSFENVRWSVVGGPAITSPEVFLAAPVLRRGPAGGPPADLDLARARGARVLICGTAGDDVLYAAGVLRDFARHGRWAPVLRHLWRRTSVRAIARGVVDAALGVLPPPQAWRASKRLFERPAPSPRWLGPALAAIYPRRWELPELPSTVSWSSHVACGVWARVTNPQLGSVLDTMVDYGMDAGIEVRAPYADVRLIEHVLAIPWDQRDPRGHYRRTGRDALGPLLPPEFSQRTGQHPWTEVWRITARQALPAVAPLIESGPWLSAPYIDRAVARAMLRETLASGAAAEHSLLVPELGALEAWLRGLLRYNPAREVEEWPIA